MDSVRIAMLGGGFVANFYMQGLQDVGGHEVVVVASQREDTAKSLA
jgi:predicted dehydrogenase